MPTQAERMARVEARLDSMEPKGNETDQDVKIMIAAHHRQSGASKVWAGLAAALLTLGGVIGRGPSWRRALIVSSAWTGWTTMWRDWDEHPRGSGELHLAGHLQGRGPGDPGLGLGARLKASIQTAVLSADTQALSERAGIVTAEARGGELAAAELAAADDDGLHVRRGEQLRDRT